MPYPSKDTTASMAWLLIHAGHYQQAAISYNGIIPRKSFVDGE